MTLVYNQVTRSASFNRDRWSGVTTYLVFDSAGASFNVDQIRSSASAAGCLDFGGTGAETAMALLMEFTSATFTPQPDGMDKYWTATFNFEASLSADGTSVETSDTKQENQVGFTSIEVDAQSVILDVWRTGATLPTSDALKSDPSLIDISGTKVDSAGDPISFVSGVLNISVRNVIIGRPDYLIFANNIGKRNSAVFTLGANATSSQNLVCPIGTLLFTGATSSRIGPNTYEVNYNFTLDTQFYHLRQVPLRNASGDVIVEQVTAGSVVSVSNPWRASKVYWKQPFSSTFAVSVLNLVTT